MCSAPFFKSITTYSKYKTFDAKVTNLPAVMPLRANKNKPYTHGKKKIISHSHDSGLTLSLHSSPFFKLGLV